MASAIGPDWKRIRERAALIPPPAFDFIREGLTFTAERVHGELAADPAVAQKTSGSRHVNGRDLCLGLRDLATQKYGRLASAVLRRWGLRRTEDFGVVVYELIARKELRNSEDDRFEDFAAVFDFDEAFAPPPKETCDLS